MNKCLSVELIHAYIAGQGDYQKRVYGKPTDSPGQSESGESESWADDIPDMTDEEHQTVKEWVKGYYGGESE